MTDATKQFQNNASREEKAEYLLNEKELRKRAERLGPASTFSQFGAVDANQERQGRFGRAEQRPIFDQSMPTLPPDHWSNQTNAIPPEEPLGYEINEPVVVGEPHEIEASLAAAEASAITSPEASAGATGETASVELHNAAKGQALSQSERAVSPNQILKSQRKPKDD